MRPPPRPRGRIARASLVVGLVALTATCRPLDWTVSDLRHASVSLAPLGSGGRTLEALIAYRTPKGRWPVRLTSGIASLQPVRVTMRDVILNPQVRQREGAASVITSDWSHSIGYEVTCTETLCEGALAVTVEIEPRPRLPTDGGVPPPLDAIDVYVSAEFSGGLEEEPLYACERKDSSTDSIDPPEELEVEVVL